MLITNSTVIEIVINTMFAYPCMKKRLKSTWLTVYTRSKLSPFSPILADGSSNTSISVLRFKVGCPFPRCLFLLISQIFVIRAREWYFSLISLVWIIWIISEIDRPVKITRTWGITLVPGFICWKIIVYLVAIKSFDLHLTLWLKICFSEMDDNLGLSHWSIRNDIKIVVCF